MTPSNFHHLVDEYLNARRGLGFGLETQEGFLRDFARHAERIGHSGPVTIELAVRWALSSRSTKPAQAARRLAIVRQFARCTAHSSTRPPKCPGRAPGTRLDATLDAPHLHRGGDGRAPAAGTLLAAPTRAATRHLCRVLCPAGVDRPAAVRGLPSHHRRRHLVNGILTIRETKFRKSRLVPLHPTTTRALRRYADRRDACPAAPRSEYFFRTEQSPRLTLTGVETTFRRLRRRLDWTAQGRTRQPRIHDLRHYSDIRTIPTGVRKMGGAREGCRIGLGIITDCSKMAKLSLSGRYRFDGRCVEVVLATPSPLAGDPRAQANG